jgi:hypothetical protein
MKKLIYLFMLAFLSTGLTSCYKSWTCACKITTTTSGRPVPDVQYIHADIIGFKGKAKRSCDAGDDGPISYGYGVTSQTECELTD